MDHDRDVDLYEAAADLTPDEHDTAFARAWITLHDGSDEAVAYQQQFVADAEQSAADAERDLKAAKATGNTAQVDHARRVLDSHRRMLADGRRWHDVLKPFLRPAGDNHAVRMRSATPRRRGGGRPAGRRVVRSSARSGDSGDSNDGEPEPLRRGRPQSKLLFDEPPLVISPTLARTLGDLTQAVILQQLHYWSGRSTNECDGHTWVFKTAADWSQEIGLTAKQARTALERLRERGLVVTTHNPRNKRDRTLWWRVDYDALTTLLDVSPDADHLPSGANGEHADHLPSEANAIAPQGKCTRAHGRGSSESTCRGGTATTTSKDRTPTTKPPTPGQLKKIGELEVETNEIAQDASTFDAADKEIKRLLAIKHGDNPEPDPNWTSVSYDGDRVQVERVAGARMSANRQVDLFADLVQSRATLDIPGVVQSKAVLARQRELDNEINSLRQELDRGSYEPDRDGGFTTDLLDSANGKVTS